MSLEAALAELQGQDAAGIDALVRGWRAELDIAARLELAEALWAEGSDAGQVAAAKLLTQARIRSEEQAVFARLCLWLEGLEGEAAFEALTSALTRRFQAEPARLAIIEGWSTAPAPHLRRAAMVVGRGWARMNFPGAADLEARETVLALALRLAGDPHQKVRQSVEALLRDLTRHDPARAEAWHAERLALKAAAEVPPEV